MSKRRTTMDDDRVAAQVRTAFEVVSVPTYDRLVGDRLLGDRSPGDRRAFRGRSIRVPAVVLALALAIPIGGLIWLRPGGGVTPAQAWTAVPLPQDSTIIARAEAACGHGSTADKAPVTGPIDEGLPLSVVDARVNRAVAFFTDGHRFATCQFSWRSDDTISYAISGQGALVSSDASSVDVLGGDWDGRDPSKMTFLVGHAGQGATRVTIRLASGIDVTASVGNGYYLAWWLEPESVVSIETADSSGRTLQVLEQPTFR
jgi:hypothetical protein